MINCYYDIETVELLKIKETSSLTEVVGYQSYHPELARPLHCEYQAYLSVLKRIKSSSIWKAPN